MKHALLVSICNPENRRAAFFREAAQAVGYPAPLEVSWQDLLANRVRLKEVVVPHSLVRIESPGENGVVEEALAALGRRGEGDRFSQPLEHGEIGDSAAWFRGFAQVLGQIDRELSPLGVAWMNHPAEIPVMFDKTACQNSLCTAGIPTPEFLGNVANYEDLQRRMRNRGMSRVFVKLRFGSSASGVVALETSKNQVKATTSVELANDGSGSLRLFNSLRIRRYTNEREVALLIDELCRREVHVEAWIPKAGWRGATFDLRVMVIAGEVQHVVMRTSHGPITNLHLGNRRGDVEAFLHELPAKSREAAWATCRRVAAVFSGSVYFGIDLLFLPNLQRHALLEVNAFGDLLPGVTHCGCDTFRSELEACSHYAARRCLSAM